MNKKAYINPELEVVKIATMQMMATSLENLDNPVTEPLAPGMDTDTNMFGF